MVKCCLCGEKIKVTSFGWDKGNNALPLNNGRCCDSCNSTKVIPARIKKLPFWNRYEWDLIEEGELIEGQNLIHQPNMTDEEIYQKLKKNKNPSLMSAKEWKKLRIIELEKRGKCWSK